MSNSVEIDASKSVEERVEKMPSEIMLAVLWSYAAKPEISFREFRGLVETWLEIREMEEIREKYFMSKAPAPHPPAEPAPSPEGEGIDYKQLYEDLVDSLLEEDVHPASGPEEVQIDQHTFVSEKDAEAEPEKKQKNAAKSAAGKVTFARRKQAALEAVKSARASGCTLQGIADQSNLSLTMVMDLINGVSRPVTDWTKLEKGLKKLGHPPRVIPKEEPHEQEEE